MKLNPEGGGTQIQMLYTCATTEMRKKGCFFMLTWFARIAIRGHNGPIFMKKGPFGFYLGAFRGHISDSLNMFLRKSCLGVKSGAKIMQNSCLGGVFPGESKLHLGYVLKLSGQAGVQY